MNCHYLVLLHLILNIYETSDDQINYNEILQLISSIQMGKLSKKDWSTLNSYDLSNVFLQKVNGLYVFAVSFILLHEFSHHYCEHNFNSEGTLGEEIEADQEAFWAMYCDLTGDERKTAMLGIVAAMRSLIFVNTNLEDDGVHPKPIERIFCYYDINTDAITLRKKQTKHF